MSRSSCLLLVSCCLLAGCPSSDSSLLPAVGGTMPPIEAAGWINGDGPTREKMAGKVAVIEAWATW